MQAIILAAGLGRRLGNLTAGNTKCMVEVNGKRLIDRTIDALLQLPLSRIIIVAGYKHENLLAHLRDKFPQTPLEFVINDVYDKTNNIYSLWLARHYLAQEDTLLLESDLIFDPLILRKASETNASAVALVAKYQPWMDGTMTLLDHNGKIQAFVPGKQFDFADADKYYKTVNIYRFSRDFSASRYIPFLEAYIKAFGDNEYYEQVLRVIAATNSSDITAVDISGAKWYEIDDIQDLKIAETIFAPTPLRYNKLIDERGGYWRYPGLTEFVTSYSDAFPPQSLINEIKASLPNLITTPPSAYETQCMLAAKACALPADCIAVAPSQSIAHYLLKSVCSPNVKIEYNPIDLHIPGLNLCIIHSNPETVSYLKAHAGLLRLDSIAEYFLQIIGKYDHLLPQAEKICKENEKRVTFICERIKSAFPHKLCDCAENDVIVQDVMPTLSLAHLLLEKYDILIRPDGKIMPRPDKQLQRLFDALINILTEHQNRKTQLPQNQ